MINAFDIIGPIMIGPSSSHTAGAVRLGRLASAIFGSIPEKVNIFLHGSFAKTYKGHGTDVALVAGILGLETDDPDIPNSLNLVKKKNIEINFEPIDLGNYHPNTVMFDMSKGDKRRTVIGTSIGGGNIVVNKIDDFIVDVRGDYNTIIVRYIDKLGMIARVSALLSTGNVNIAEMKVSRVDKGAEALMIVEMDSEVSFEILEKIKSLEAVSSLININPI